MHVGMFSVAAITFEFICVAPSRHHLELLSPRDGGSVPPVEKHDRRLELGQASSGSRCRQAKTNVQRSSSARKSAKRNEFKEGVAWRSLGPLGGLGISKTPRGRRIEIDSITITQSAGGAVVEPQQSGSPSSGFDVRQTRFSGLLIHGQSRNKLAPITPRAALLL